MQSETLRWYGVETLIAGRRFFVGRVYTTESELRAALGSQIEIKSNGLVTVWGRPPATQHS